MNFKEAVSSKWDRVSRNWKFKSTFQDEKSNIKIISLNKPGGDKWSVRNCQQEINDNIYLVWLPKGFYFVLLISGTLVENRMAQITSSLRKIVFYEKKILAQLQNCVPVRRICVWKPQKIDWRHYFHLVSYLTRTFWAAVSSAGAIIFIQFPQHKRS